MNLLQCAVNSEGNGHYPCQPREESLETKHHLAPSLKPMTIRVLTWLSKCTNGQALSPIMKLVVRIVLRCASYMGSRWYGMQCKSHAKLYMKGNDESLGQAKTFGLCAVFDYWVTTFSKEDLNNYIDKFIADPKTTGNFSIENWFLRNATAATRAMVSLMDLTKNNGLD